MRANLEGVDLRGEDLQGAKLHGANLREAKLERCKLQKALLNGALLQKANLEKANLEEAELPGAKLQEAKLIDTYLRNVILTDANLRGANMEGADLSGIRTSLKRAEFEDANMGRADLRNLTAENLQLITEKEKLQAELDRALREESILEDTPPSRPNFRRACFRGARLEGTDLSACNITRTYLSGAWLDKTRLRRDQVSTAEHKMLAHVARIFKASLAKIGLTREPEERVVIGEEAGARALRIRMITRVGGRNQKAGSGHKHLCEDEALREELEKYGDRKRLLYYTKAKSAFYREGKNGYRALKQNFEDLGDNAASSWAYLRERRMEKRERFFEGCAALLDHKPREALRNFWEATKDAFVQLICDYGENMLRVLASIIFVFLFFAALFALIGIQRIGASDVSIWDYFLFSLGPMTTMRPDALQPQCYYLGEFLSRIETLLAIALTGLLGFVLGNRVRRR